MVQMYLQGQIEGSIFINKAIEKVSTERSKLGAMQID